MDRILKFLFGNHCSNNMGNKHQWMLKIVKMGWRNRIFTVSKYLHEKYLLIIIYTLTYTHICIILHWRNLADTILAKGSRLTCQWYLVDVRYPWGEESTQSLWCSFQKPITPVYLWKNISDKLILGNILRTPNEFYTKPLRSWETRTGWGTVTD